MNAYDRLLQHRENYSTSADYWVISFVTPKTQRVAYLKNPKYKHQTGILTNTEAFAWQGTKTQACDRLNSLIHTNKDLWNIGMLCPVNTENMNAPELFTESGW